MSQTWNPKSPPSSDTPLETLADTSTKREPSTNIGTPGTGPSISEILKFSGAATNWDLFRLFTLPRGENLPEWGHLATVITGWTSITILSPPPERERI